MENLIRNLLKKIGMPAHLSGHSYWVIAIQKTMEDPGLLHDICNMYRDVAKSYKLRQVSGSMVERAMRHAVEVTFDRIDPDSIEKYFGNTIDAFRAKPTNAEFLGAMVGLIMEEQEKQANEESSPVPELCAEAIELLNNPDVLNWIKTNVGF